ncbi:FadR/GntR family transcriptional regulator [Nesterenkonia ebinurensis]|uniref:FadR/GntR family transcriptional regulator n=1 Tax=Nesterenkonia ebinurensis TaxID=2608252 RepID=UPI001CC52E43|nr:FadR/GntR family transcriptional regulator [Nesterenkonia ebinurensis]
MPDQHAHRFGASSDAVAEVRQRGLSDALGKQIVTGALAPGSVLTLESLQERFGVSRTVARDGVKVLESLGLLYSKRRVGLVVTEPRAWNVYAPLVIRWRLDSADARATYIELTQLRIAVEPEAAELAAQRRSGAEADELRRLAARMRTLGEAGELEQFMVVDVAFHCLILEASGNTMFAALGDVVGEALHGRTTHGLMPATPMPEALDAHDAVAHAIAHQYPDAARKQMQFLVDEVRAALEHDAVGDAHLRAPVIPTDERALR